MDPSATPWRVLEDPTDQVAAPNASTEVATRIQVPRSALVVGGLAAVLAIAAFFLAFGSGPSGVVAVDGGAPLDSERPDGSPRASATGSTAVGRTLVVEVVGAVDRPGVFHLAADARVGDLIDAAGGYGPRVDTDRAARELNLAAPLHDGDQVRVPSRDDPAAPTTPSSGSGTGSSSGGPGAHAAGPIDLNSATASELDSLPGIGPVTAAKILASRDEQPFATVDDLRTRKLLGEKAFANLKELVMVR